MINRSPPRTVPPTRPRVPLRRLLWLAIPAVADPLARASVLSGVPDCRATGGDWSCYLPGIFHFLLFVAVILVIILAAVIFLAVKSYRKNKDDQKVGS